MQRSGPHKGRSAVGLLLTGLTLWLSACAGPEVRETATAVVETPPAPVSYAHLPKRGPKDPISVVLLPPQRDKELEGLERQVPASTTFAIKMENLMSRDRVVQLTVVGPRRPAPANSDIEIQLEAHTQQFVGKSNYGGPSSLRVVVTADIRSRFLPDKAWIEESGKFLERDGLYRKVAKEILRVIHEEMGPQIPADRTLAGKPEVPFSLDLNK